MFNRQAFAACSIALCLALAGLAAPAQALELRVGVSEVEFNWAEGAGNPTHYAVWVSRDSAPFAPYTLVDENRVEVAVSPGEQVSIYVYGVRPHPLGGWEVGPASQVSDRVLAFATPEFPDADGSWLLHCASCGASEERDLADASVVSEQFSPNAAWSYVTRAEFSDGSTWLVWQHANSGALLLSDADNPGAPPIGPVATPLEFFQDTMDTAPDGGDEFIFVAHQAGNRLDRYALDAGDELEWTGSSPGMSGGELGPIADYTGDGREDLLWIHRGQGLVAVWSFSDFDPVQRKWVFQDSYLLDLNPFPGYEVVDAADYDGNGSIDIVWRGDATGDLWINYLSGGLVDRVSQVPPLSGDDRLELVNSVDVDGIAGAELAMRDADTGRLWILYPRITASPVREAVLDVGPDWEVVYAGP